MLEVCDWPVIYTDCGQGVAPVTLTYASGTTIELSRQGDIVTATATPRGIVGTDQAKQIPAGFAPAGNTAMYKAVSSDISQPGAWAIIIDELGGFGQIGINTSPLSAGPYLPFTTQWLAEPLPAGASGYCEALAKLTAAEVIMYEQRAAEILWEWTGRRFGVCEVTVRPCQEGCGGRSATSTFWGRGPRYDPMFPRFGLGGQTTGGWMPVLLAGEWFNIGCGCTGGCRCGVDPRYALRLPGPIGSVTSVVIDGETLPPTAYRVDGGQMLVRTDGEMWPKCQDLHANPGEPNTFSVTYKRGVPVPVGGQIAAGRLACEMALADCGSEDCALPERMQSMTRQGISIGVTLDGETWDSSTSIWAIDSWVAAVNRPRPFAGAYSVDVPSRYPR